MQLRLRKHIDITPMITLLLAKMISLCSVLLKRISLCMSFRNLHNRICTDTKSIQNIPTTIEHKRIIKRLPLGEFCTPYHYDYTKSTSCNYIFNEKLFFGDFVEIRKMRDYNHHVNYTKKRQLWQDMIVWRTISLSKKVIKPWIIFTGGPMGAGKGYTLSRMSKNGYLLPKNIIHIDPDYFKQHMPEWKQYIKRNCENAGTLCHRESCYIQEIAQEFAMQQSQNVCVDGSLRNYKWYSKVFADIRNRFPEYRIAIFYVYASPNIVRERIAKRKRETGRGIPEWAISKSLIDPVETIRRLTPKSDFVARFRNDKCPILENYVPKKLLVNDLIDIQFLTTSSRFSKI